MHPAHDFRPRQCPEELNRSADAKLPRKLGQIAPERSVSDDAVFEPESRVGRLEGRCGANAELEPLLLHQAADAQQPDCLAGPSPFPERDLLGSDAETQGDDASVIETVPPECGAAEAIGRDKEGISQSLEEREGLRALLVTDEIVIAMEHRDEARVREGVLETDEVHPVAAEVAQDGVVPPVEERLHEHHVVQYRVRAAESRQIEASEQGAGVAYQIARENPGGPDAPTAPAQRQVKKMGATHQVVVDHVGM